MKGGWCYRSQLCRLSFWLFQFACQSANYYYFIVFAFMFFILWWVSQQCWVGTSLGCLSVHQFVHSVSQSASQTVSQTYIQTDRQTVRQTVSQSVSTYDSQSDSQLLYLSGFQWVNQSRDWVLRSCFTDVTCGQVWSEGKLGEYGTIGICSLLRTSCLTDRYMIEYLTVHPVAKEGKDVVHQCKV